MKRPLSIIVLLLSAGAFLMIAPPAHAKGKSGDEAAQIKALEEQWLAAYLKGDSTYLEKIESDDFILFDPTGASHTKADDVRDLKTGAMKWSDAQFEEIKVRVYGKTAIATGIAKIKGSYNGQDISGRIRFTDVFVHKKDEWHAVSTQLTMVK